MDWTRQERVALGILGFFLLAGCTLLFFQRRTQALEMVQAPPASVGQSWDERLSASRQIDLNAASAAELERLPGLGPRLAARIIAERDVHGPFYRVEDLLRVSGIGPKLLERL
ncbi:MAG: helix-hairpin-helix domain-containing protein, partial [Candidatus Omnitrophica bacterium]|nr:helix-hairpin-helix domain-containing protein [Candidatus Omnitrophota bacterium]